MIDENHAHNVLNEFQDEYRRARNHFPPMKSYHEGYAILLEEVDELWEEIKANGKRPTKIRMEAIQVGAMILAFVSELSDNA